MPEQPRRVCYVHSDDLIAASDCLPANEGRSSLVHSLISSFNLLRATTDDNDGDDSSPEPPAQESDVRANIFECVPASEKDLCRYHDAAYVRQLLSAQDDSSDGSDSTSEEDEEDGPARKKRRTDAQFGLHDDCPNFDQMSSYARLVAGASMTAARALRDGQADIAISWTGGRHHAKRSQASGFCYVQDVALAILELRKAPSLLTGQKKIDRVMYIDLDLHHGDGVEEAFYDTFQVLTVSTHLHAKGFFPATGALEEVGPEGSKAHHHVIDIALRSGASDETMRRVFDRCIQPLYDAYKPDAIVLQCGADGLAGDPCREWALTLAGYEHVLKRVMAWNRKLLLLGGGGYHHANTARLWANLTAVVLGKSLEGEPVPPNMPDHLYRQFSPSFTIEIDSSSRTDLNDDDYLGLVEASVANSTEVLRKRYGS